LIADAVAGGETAFDGPFWDAMRPGTVLPSVVANKVAVFLVGGWHDAFQRGAPLNYAGCRTRTRAARRTTDATRPAGVRAAAIDDGPLYHVSDYGGLHFHALQLRWFDYWLNDDAEAEISGPPFTFRPSEARGGSMPRISASRGDTDPVLSLRVRPPDRRLRARNLHGHSQIRGPRFRWPAEASSSGRSG